MAKIDPNLLIEQEWTGTFFPPDRQDLSFAGRLKYSPTEGLQLEFARAMNIADRELKWRYLHGHTSKGVPLTLVGEFSAERNGFSFNHGMSYWTSAGYHFHYAIFGHHFEDTDTFDTFEFDISGVQEFFAPDDMKIRIPHSRKEIVTAYSDVGKVCVIHSSKFHLVGDDLRALFHSEDSEPLDELQSAYVDIRARYPAFLPFLKKQMDYLFRFIPKNELTVPDAHDIIASVADLFAMLSFEPAKLRSFSATARDEEGKPYSMTVFPWVINDKATIERSLSKRSYHSLPLNNADVNLGLLLSNWLSQADRYSTISSLLQNKVSVISEHEIHGNIVLAAAQLEGIALQEGVTAKKDKYEYGLRGHASEKLRKRLSAMLDCAEADIGETVSDLRNEIAHVGRPKKLLAKISRRKQFLVSSALQTVVIGYALEQIGVSTQARDKYQDLLIGRG